MNPRNALRELLRMMAPPANGDDLSMVAAEVKEIFESAPLMSSTPFGEPVRDLIQLIGAPKADKNLEKHAALISAFTNEVLALIDNDYIAALLNRLEEILVHRVHLPPSFSDRAVEIQALTGTLLSLLLDRGASVESLFQLYRQIITRLNPPKQFDFGRRFALMRKVIAAPPREFEVVFALDNVSNPENFPSVIGGVSFSAQPPDVPNPKPAVSKYLTTNPRRLFATVRTQTQDFRTAGSHAYVKVNDILDLVRFEYERERLHLHEEFVITDGRKQHRVYPIPKVVPNQTTQLAPAELEVFVASVNELAGSQAFAGDGRDRVQAAFRLYRMGADSNIFENKLVHWWTATEHLVTASSGIARAVEEALVPVLCLRYVGKLLQSHRNALVDLKIELLDPANGQPIQLRDLSMVDLFTLFTRPDNQQPLLAAVNSPYAREKLAEFVARITDAAALQLMLARHEQRVRWQIQRLWRARCNIVHSAERSVNAALLCANLEFYLKTTLTALLAALRNVPTLASPKEFFDRQAHAYRMLLAELPTGGRQRLHAALSSV
ncbi:MAG: hypothetical protein BroJett026_34710 [Betaproteobacteria bacterium]|nr:MAG: hypothetical protein BroJett026_34710 [Betaproteobacteria bacterium]